MSDAKSLVNSITEVSPGKNHPASFDQNTKQRIIPEFPYPVVKKKVDEDHERIKKSVSRKLELEELKEDPERYEKEMKRKDYEAYDYDYLNFVRGGMPITKDNIKVTNALRINLLPSPDTPISEKDETHRRSSTISFQKSYMKLDLSPSNAMTPRTPSRRIDFQNPKHPQISKQKTASMYRMIKSLKLDKVFTPNPLDTILTYSRQRSDRSAEVETALISAISYSLNKKFPKKI